MSDLEEDPESNHKVIKISFVGEPSTGKSALCGWVSERRAAAAAAGRTAGAEVRAGRCGGVRPPVPLHLCDVAGASLQCDDLLDTYLYQSHIVIFVYDITNANSFERLEIWLSKVKKIFEHESKKPLMALFGNKSDLEHRRAVKQSSVQKFASEHLVEVFRVSSKTGDKVNSAITVLVARVLGLKAKPPPSAPLKPPPAHAQPSAGQGHALIMNRKALRKIQWKASSSVCCVQ